MLKQKMSSDGCFYRDILIKLQEYNIAFLADRDIVPEWLLGELLERQQQLLKMPLPVRKVCRGSLLNHSQYEIDQREWGYRA
jgi:hypothetical protein